jgi:hypothetical protein
MLMGQLSGVCTLYVGSWYYVHVHLNLKLQYIDPKETYDGYSIDELVKR